MKILERKAFTLVELLVVITIITIMAVVWYQSFWWATDKAHKATKKANIILVDKSLWNFYTEHNYYPMPQNKTNENRWWYSKTIEAQSSTTIKVVYDDAEVKTLAWVLADYKWWWVVYWSGSEWKKWWTDEKQIWAKWVVWRNWKFNKIFLKGEVYDSQLWDIELTGDNDKKMIDYWIGKFVYAVYSRPRSTTNWNIRWAWWTAHELAATFKKDSGEWYETYLIGDYSNDICVWNESKCPETLVWLKNWTPQDDSKGTMDSNQWIPYPITDFVE
jgi:prepilin-type N-terminal cleavage/methylation domain-containing protein